jgi:hypothetical protein
MLIVKISSVREQHSSSHYTVFLIIITLNARRYQHFVKSITKNKFIVLSPCLLQTMLHDIILYGPTIKFSYGTTILKMQLIGDEVQQI